MADISKFSIVTNERKPAQWRAAITEKVRPALNLTIAALFAVVLGACETTGSQQAAGGRPGDAGDYPS